MSYILALMHNALLQLNQSQIATSKQLSSFAGIPDKPHELSYVEKRALKAKVLENLPKYYEKPLEFCRNLEPEILNPEILDKQLVDLKAREQELVAELAAKNAELCETLNEAVELRFGPTQEDSSKMIKSKIEVEQVKAQYVQQLNELTNVNVYLFVCFSVGSSKLCSQRMSAV